MNVTEGELRAYIQLFHETLKATAKEHLSEEIQKDLLHLSLTPARIIGYLSTQFGVAIEYQPSAALEIEIQRGSARVEDLLMRAPSSVAGAPPFLNISGTGSTIYGCKFSGRFPFRLTRQDANVSMGDVVVEAGQWKRAFHYAEVYGNRSLDLWRPEKAVSRAKDEVLVAIIQAQRANERRISVGEYIDGFKRKTVLVLGDYDPPGMARIEAIVYVLRQLGYEPILIKDIPDHPHQHLRQKVVAIGAISRFVVVDDSSKSGHLFEVELCDHNKWVTILLRAQGQGGSWMTAGLSHLSNVILEQPYDPLSPDSALSRAASWAEERLQQLQIKFDSTYPWRTKS